LELKIGEWRRERHNRFNLSFDTANRQLSEWLARGWALRVRYRQPLSGKGSMLSNLSAGFAD
jgi:hypothetical protein